MYTSKLARGLQWLTAEGLTTRYCEELFGTNGEAALPHCRTAALSRTADKGMNCHRRLSYSQFNGAALAAFFSEATAVA